MISMKLKQLRAIGYAVLLTFMSITTVIAYENSTQKSGTKVGHLAPDFTASDLDGNSFTLSEFRGKKPVYIIFWATWCKACKQEIPNFISLHKEYNDDIEIISINVDSLSFWSSLKKSNSRVRDYIKTNAIPYRVILDDDKELISQFRVQATPTQILIGKNGIIERRYPLYNAKTEALIKRAIAAD